MGPPERRVRTGKLAMRIVLTHAALETLRFVGSRGGVRWILGADIDTPVVANTDFQRHNGNALFVDCLSVRAKVTLLNSSAR